jgi:hypothetical protein
MERIAASPPVEPPALSDEEKAKIQNELNELLKIPAGMLTWGEARKIKQLEEQLKA